MCVYWRVCVCWGCSKVGQKEVRECVFVCVCLHLKFLNICSLFSVMAAVGMSVCCTHTRVCACVCVHKRETASVGACLHKCMLC